MKQEFISDAIDALMRLFFRGSTSRKYLAIATLEFYVDDLRLLEDTVAVAKEIEEQRAFALIPYFKRFDYVAAKAVENELRGNRGHSQ